jgi:hypothetical protein
MDAAATFDRLRGEFCLHGVEQGGIEDGLVIPPERGRRQARGLYWKVIMSVRLRVVAFGFKGWLAKFALPEFKTL